MERISTRDAVSRLTLTLGVGFSSLLYGFDVLTNGGVGSAVILPALLPVVVTAWDKHRAKEGDVPDGVTVTE